MLQGSTVQPRPIFQRDSIWIAGIEATTADNGRYIVPADISSVFYTVYEQDSPNVNTNEAVPDFENIPVSVESAVRSEIKETTVYDRFGSRIVPHNTQVTVGPVMKTVDGNQVAVYPLRTIGKYYRIEVTFRFVDPMIAPIVQVEMVYPI